MSEHKILNIPIEIVKPCTRPGGVGLIVCFTNKTIVKKSKDDEEQHFVCNYFDDVLSRAELEKYKTELAWKGYHEPGSLILTRAASQFDGCWDATIPMGGAKNPEEYKAAINRGMFNALVVAGNRNYGISRIAVGGDAPLNPLPLFCAIAEYAQRGGRAVPVFLYYNQPDKTVHDLIVLVKRGRFSEGALPESKRRTIRIISPGCSLRECFEP